MRDKVSFADLFELLQREWGFINKVFENQNDFFSPIQILKCVAAAKFEGMLNETVVSWHLKMVNCIDDVFSPRTNLTFR